MILRSLFFIILVLLLVFDCDAHTNFKRRRCTPHSTPQPNVFTTACSTLIAVSSSITASTTITITTAASSTIAASSSITAGTTTPSPTTTKTTTTTTHATTPGTSTIAATETGTTTAVLTTETPTTITPKPTTGRTTTKSAGGNASIDQMVDEFVKKIKKIKVEDSSSVEKVFNMTASLMKDLKNNNKVKGNVMKVTLMMEEFGLNYAKHHFKNSNTSSMMKKSEELIFEMRKVTTKQRIVFPPKSEQSAGKAGQTTINLPDSLFDGQGQYVVNALFPEMADNIPTESSDKGLKQVISPVILSTLDPKPKDVLTDNVTIVLEHYFKNSSKFIPSCVFWDLNRNNTLGGVWSNRGCTVVDSNETRTVCSCNHLTSFALLMQVDDTPLVDERHALALSYITYIGCALSLLGEVLTVLAYLLLMDMKQSQCQVRVNLAISLAIAQIFFLSGITATSNLGVCTFVAVMLHYFYLVAFGWMMLEGVYLYLMVVKVFNTVIKMKLYYIFAWGYPAIAVGISLIVASTFKDGINSYTHQKFCWVSFLNGLIWAFVGPVVLISLVNAIILICVVREMAKLNHSKSSDMDTFRQGVKACVVLFPLLGLTWLFGLLSVTNAGIVFQYIFTILNSLQGFLIFVLHCVRSGEIRGSCNRKLKRWKLTRNAGHSSSSSKSTGDSFVSYLTKNQTQSQLAIHDSLPRPDSKHNEASQADIEMDAKSIGTSNTSVDM